MKATLSNSIPFFALFMILPCLSIGQVEFSQIVPDDFLGNSFPVSSNEIDIADVDNDGDLDLYFVRPSTIYINDGNGVFTLPENNPLSNGSGNNNGELADIDGDNDLDLLVINILDTLIDGALIKTEYLQFFVNDGNGGFSEDKFLCRIDAVRLILQIR